MMWATALTFLKGFKAECLAVAAVGCLVALPIGVTIGKRWDAHLVSDAQADTARSDAALASYKASVATATATALTQGFAQQTEAATAVNSLRDFMVTQIAKSQASILAAVKANTDAFRSATNEPQWACLDFPLPDAALRVYERSGGSGAPTPDR